MEKFIFKYSDRLGNVAYVVAETEKEATKELSLYTEIKVKMIGSRSLYDLSGHANYLNANMVTILINKIPPF